MISSPYCALSKVCLRVFVFLHVNISQLLKVAEHSFDTCVSFSFFSKTLQDLLVAKNGNTQAGAHQCDGLLTQADVCAAAMAT